MDSFIQLITVLVIFAFVLFITYVTTRWIGNFQRNQFAGRNIELLEAARLNQSQYIQIVRIGSRYLVLGISKDTITQLGELSEEEVSSFNETNGSGSAIGASAQDAFGKLLEQARNVMPHK